MSNFSDWLNEQLKARYMSQAQLSKLSGISGAHISRMMSGISQPGEDACTAISQALKIPPEDVFRAAGLLPPKKTEDYSEELAYRINMLPKDDQVMIEAFIDTLINKRGNAEKKTKIKKADQF